MLLTQTNPVTVGNPTKKSDYDSIWNNVATIDARSALPPIRDNFRGLTLQSVPAGAGSGATINVTGISSGGAIATATLGGAGTGYNVNDCLLVATEGSNAVFKVTGVSANPGPITGITMVNPGTGYTVANGKPTGEIINSVKFSFQEGILTTAGNPKYNNLNLQAINLGAQLNLVVDTTPGVAGGMDIANSANPTIGKWYHIWAIFNPTTGQMGGFLSLSDGATTTPQYPSLPSGYTYKAYMGAIYRHAGNGFATMLQRGKSAFCGQADLPVVVSNGTSTTYAALTPTVPSNASAVKLNYKFASGTNGYGYFSLDGVNLWGQIFSSTSFTWMGEMEMPLNLSQQFYYKVDAYNGTFWIYVNGWVFP